MKNGINVSVEKDSIKAMEVAVVNVIKTCFACHCDQTVTNTAIECLKSLQPDNTMISNNVITSGSGDK